MEPKDYYAILGVAPGADADAIRQAYRKLARQYHPDVNPGDKTAEERFKEINEAHQALSDPERRGRYDELREQYQRWQQRGGRGEFDWGRAQAAPDPQTYTYSGSPEDFADMFGDDIPFSDFFSSMFGQAAGGQGQRAREARPRRGRDLETPVEITLEEAFHGTSRGIQIGERRIEAKIPPGVRTGSRVRLAGHGGPGAAGGPPGDLYLVVQVTPHPQFEREGDDLYLTLPLDIYTAAAGGSAQVPTLDGAVTLKIPPRTQADRSFRLRGKGMPKPEKPSGSRDEAKPQRGDLYARVKLVLPEPLSDEELETLRQLARARRTSNVHA